MAWKGVGWPSFSDSRFVLFVLSAGFWLRQNAGTMLAGQFRDADWRFWLVAVILGLHLVYPVMMGF
jgi:hypothetical protein